MQNHFDSERNEKSSGTRVFVAWHREHYALYLAALNRSSDLSYFPMNQKAAAPFLRNSRSSLPHFWNLISSQELDEVDEDATQYAAMWKSGRMRCEAVRAWIWAREASYTRRLILSLEQSVGTPLSYVVPSSNELWRESWHGAFVVPRVVFEEWGFDGSRNVEWIEGGYATNFCGSQATINASRRFDTPAPSGEWILLSCFGLPDLRHHLKSLLNYRKQVVALVDPHESGSIEDLVEIAANTKGRVSVFSVDTNVSERQEENTDHIPEGSGHLGWWLVRTRQFNYRTLEQKLTQMFGLNPPIECIVCDHDSPQTTILVDCCSRHGIDIRVLPHSSWPMDEPFFLSPPSPTCQCMYVAASRRAAENIKKNLKVSPKAVLSRPLPSPRYRVSLRRLVRTLIKLCRNAGPARNIGVVVSSGEAIVAPDLLLSDVGKQLQSLLAATCSSQTTNQPVFHVRLRKNEDLSETLSYLSSSLMEKSRVVWSTSDACTPVSYLRRMDLVVEIGMPTTMMLEAFAEMVPYVRLGDPVRRRVAFALAAEVVPRISTSEPWKQLCSIAASGLKRRLLALRQWGFLLQDTWTPVDLST